MLGGMQQQALKRVLSNPEENERIRAYAGTLAAIEREQREAMRDHFADDLGVDPEEFDLVEPPEAEERISTLCRAIAAHMAGDPWNLWLEELAPEELQNAEQAAEYAGMDDDAWSEQVTEWAAQYRDRAGDAVAGRTDRELASVFIEDTFGVGLDTFEQAVVGFDPGEVFREVVAAPLETHTEAVTDYGEDDAE
ncbi:hypothetical protein [Haloparvum sedimenti]|uniref:hypothetical protein n=1 Tax=Haloparvum sedimenti TaxID=1678448 RepID=UPI00071E7CD1|nr:hypothetical protein [Haloparvum sedimenti]